MGILDTIVGETTEWLLKKADGVLDKSKREAFNLYEHLYKIDEYFVRYGNKIFNFMTPEARDYPFDRIDNSYYDETYQSFYKNWRSEHHHIKSIININIANINSSLIHFESLKSKISSESRKNKGYWDDFEQFLKALKASLNNIENLADDFFYNRNRTSEGYRILVKHIKQTENMLNEKNEFKKYLETNIDGQEENLFLQTNLKSECNSKTFLVTSNTLII